MRFTYQFDGTIEQFIEFYNAISEVCRQRGLTVHQGLAVMHLMSSPEILPPEYTTPQDPNAGPGGGGM